MILLSYLIYLIVYIPSLSKWTGCRAETCLQFFVYQPRNFLISNTYLFTISCTLIAGKLNKLIKREREKGGNK